MEQKKSRLADLERQRYKFFLMALILVASLFYCALQWTSQSPSEVGSDDDDPFENIDFSKLHKDDMVPAITDTDKPEDETNIHSSHLVTQQQVAATSRLVIGDGTGEIEKATVEKVVPQTIEQDDQQPEGFKVLEELPQFPGGDNAFVQWITRQLSYPASNQRMHRRGSVVVSFIVTKDGTTRELKLEKSTDAVLANAVLTVMQHMPKWKPGKTDGKPCNAMIAVPIDFEL